MRQQILIKALLLVIATMTALGCGEGTDPNYITNNYYETTYNVTQLQILCAGMNEGDEYEIHQSFGSRVVIKDGNCVLMVGAQ